MTTNTLVFNNNGGAKTGTSYTLPSGILVAGHSYRWAMTSFNSAGEGSQGSYRYFQTQAALLSAPTINSPGSTTSPGTTLSTLTPTFSWSAVTGATGYGLYIRDMTTNTLVFNNNGGAKTGTSYTLPSGILVAGHSYRWAMTSFNSAGEGSQGSYRYFQTEAATLAAPTNVAASDGTYTDMVRVTWTASNGATGYEVWRNTTNNSGTATKLSDVTGTSFDNTTTTAGTIYYYWVKAKNASGTSGFSAGDSGYRAVAATIPAPPTNVSASDGTFTDKVRVTWTASANATGGYELWRNTTNNSGTATKLSDVTGTSFDNTTTTAGTIYYYWVKAKNASGTSGFSTGDSGYRATSVPSGDRPDPSIAPGIRFLLPLATDSPTHYYFDRNPATNGVLAWNGVTTDGLPGGAYEGHRGTDFSGLPRNTPVLAAASGTIVEKVDGLPDGNINETTNPNGNFVRLYHGNDSTGVPIYTVYLHLNNGSVTSKSIGATINAGEQIGGIGTSGQSTGLHLHFETQRGAPPNRIAFDPYAATGESSWWAASSPASPEVEVLGNGIVIVDGDTTPSTTDRTNLGTTTQGGATLSRTFTVRNIGTGTLTTSNLTVPVGFTITNGLAASIAAGGSDTVTIRLDTAVAGTKTGQLSFNTNDSDENPYNFTITGVVNPSTSLVAEVEVRGNGVVILDGDTTPDVADHTSFGTLSQGGATLSRVFTVMNTGTATLTTSGLVVPAGYTVMEGLSSSIAAGGSDTITVRIDTATAGTKTGQISFNNNDSDENPYNFTITGVVTSVASLAEVEVVGNGYVIEDGDTTPRTQDRTNLGTTTQGGTTLSRTFTVRNTGTATLTTSNLTVPAGFTITNALASSIAAGGSDTITIRLDTAIAGTKTGQLSFNTNDSDENPYNFTITGVVNALALAAADIAAGGADAHDAPSSRDQKKLDAKKAALTDFWDRIHTDSSKSRKVKIARGLS